jgi:hypothetical protein
MTAAKARESGARPVLTPAEALAELESGALVVDAPVVAALLDVSIFTLYEAVKRGDAPVMPIMVGRRQRYRVADVRRVLGLESS